MDSNKITSQLEGITLDWGRRRNVGVAVFCYSIPSGATAPFFDIVGNKLRFLGDGSWYYYELSHYEPDYVSYYD